MKIAYIVPTLEPSGGAERIITEKANYFADFFQYEVYIITLFQHKDSPNCYHLSDKIQQINLAIPFFSQYKFKYPKRLWMKLKLNYCMHKTITNTINLIDPDILIGVSFSQADNICSIKCRAKKIIECHEPKYIYSSRIYSSTPMSRILTNRIFSYLYYHSIEKNADLVVTLTEDEKRNWRKAKRVEVIPNFSSMTIMHTNKLDSKRVIAVGRLHEEKGFERLLDIWKSVVAKHDDWQLDIFGEGRLKDKLIDIIRIEHIKNVILHRNTPNIEKQYANSSICCVTSLYEGFSLVILEAMRHGVPCIAYDCPNGPRNIINDQLCGYLIKDGDKDSYVEKLCILIENESLRKRISEAAIERAKHFNKEKIMLQWKRIIEIIHDDSAFDKQQIY